MTVLTIDGKEVELREDDSFSYISESELFTDSNGYTLDIELPLKGSEINRAIFGFIELNPPSSASWRASLWIDGMELEGTAVLTDISDTTLKVQFLQGQASAGYDNGVDNRFINELDIADRVTLENERRVQEFPMNLRQPSLNQARGQDYRQQMPGMEIPAVALPWINDNEDTVQNDDIWGRRTGWSWMPYLLPMAQRIAEAVGYTLYCGSWDRLGDPRRELLICNAVPCSSARQLTYRCSQALPRWSVREFFENLGPALGGRFIIDTLRQTISFVDFSSWFHSRTVVELKDVEDVYKITSSFGLDDTDGNYLTAKPYRYADAGTLAWKYMDCPWILNSAEVTARHSFATYGDMIKYLAEPGEHNIRNKTMHRHLFFVEDTETWYCIRVMTTVQYVSKKKYKVSTVALPMPINQFGPADYDSTATDDYQELKVLPAPVWNNYIHLSPDGCFDMTAYLQDGGDPDALYEDITEMEVNADSMKDALTAADADIYQTPIVDAIDNGEPATGSAHYDNLYLGYWAGSDSPGVPQTTGPDFDMRLNTGQPPYHSLPKIDETIKYTFGWLADTVPDPNAIFYIDGRRWICRKLETTFTARGRSRRITGEFYPIVD